MIKYGRLDESLVYTLTGIEDEVDCAIMNDEEFNNSLAELEKAESEEAFDVADSAIDSMGQPIDSSLDYSDVPLDHSPEDVIANDLIAADRDMALEPLEDDEILDAVMGDDDITETRASDIDLEELADE